MTLEDSWKGIATGNDDRVPTNRTPVVEGTSSIGKGLDVTAPTRGSNTGPLIKPPPDNRFNVGVRTGLLDETGLKKPAVDGVGSNTEMDGFKSAVRIGRPLATGLKIGAGTVGVRSCADGVVD